MRKKRVLLVNANVCTAPYPVPPLGLCLIAESIEKYYTVKVYDATFGSVDKLVNEIRVFKPDYIGVGIRNIDDYSADSCARADNKSYFIPEIDEKCIQPLRTVFTGIIILGGAGFSIFPHELMRRFDADYGITGDGTVTMCQLLDALDNGHPLQGISGLFIKDHSDGSVVHLTEEKQVQHSNIDEVRSNIDKWINYTPYNKNGAYPIQTKRGCPHSCIYCTYPCIEGKNYQLRSATSVADELENVNSRITTTFEFVDSVFNDPPEHAERICEEIIKRKLKVRLRTMGINPKNVNANLISQMQQAGFKQIDCTPDTASEQLLATYGKNFNKKDLIRSAHIFHDEKIPVMWFFILGGPGETIDTLNETFDFIESYTDDLDLIYLFDSMRIYPGTKLYNIAVDDGCIRGNESILEPVYYRAKPVRDGIMEACIKERRAGHLNWLTSSETKPDPVLMHKVMNYRTESGVDEPMFRSILRVKWGRVDLL
jgi:radical SAM superfamily enzyme YgiQ (UPF0313 family)